MRRWAQQHGAGGSAENAVVHGLEGSGHGRQPVGGERAFPLAMADEGTSVRVVALHGSEQLGRRATEMGLNVGAELVVRQREAGGLVVMRGETRFALGGGMAHRILVTPVVKA